MPRYDNTDTAPAAPVLDANDQPVNPNAPSDVVEPTVAASADNDDVVAPTTTVDAGPAVISSADVSTDEDAPAPFDGTLDAEGREKLAADTYAAQEKAAADSAGIAAAQRREDVEFRNENPDVPVVRAANPAVGGESFTN